MDHSVTFARHYARLLWLLLHEPANVDEQKATLRALVTVSKDGVVSMSASGDALTANGGGVPGALSGVREVARQMGSHGVGEVAFDAGASAAGILGSARLLAGEAAVGDGGVAALAGLQAIGAAGVRFVARPLPATVGVAASQPVTAPAAAISAAVPVGASASLGSYGIALWAMTRAPVATVAALRETSVLFAALLGTWLLKERFSLRRALGTAAILAGVFALRLG